MYTFVENDLITSITQNVRLILTTQKGSDPHRPEFGCDLSQLQDSSMSFVNAGRVKGMLADAIEEWEPRVEVDSVSIQRDGSNLTVTVFLKIKETGELIKEEVIYG